MKDLKRLKLQETVSRIFIYGVIFFFLGIAFEDVRPAMADTGQTIGTTQSSDSMLLEKFIKSKSEDRSPASTTTKAGDIIPLGTGAADVKSNGFMDFISFGPIEYFSFKRPKIGLSLSHEFEEEKRTNKGKVVTNDTIERFEIETDGWVYHPALLTYGLSFQPEWRQQTEEYDGGEETKRDTYLSGYNMNCTFFKHKPCTLSLFSSRQKSSVKSPFSGKSETESDNYGGNLSFINRLLPTSFSYFNTSSTQTGFYSSENEHEEFDVKTGFSFKNNSTKLESSFTDKERTTEGSTTGLKTSEHEIRNDWKITGDNMAELDSFLSIKSTESENQDTKNLRFYEDLHLRHMKNLKSDYRFDYNKYEYGDSERDRKSFKAKLWHLLYENLRTTIEGRTSIDDFDQGTEELYSGNLDFDYIREIPWGTINLTTGYDYETTNREMDEGYIWITETVELKTGGFTLLANEYVDIDSIEVYDDEGNLYINEIDYTLTEIDNFVRISRITFGNIADGDKVSVTYRYLNNASYRDAVASQSYGIDFHLWSVLTLSYDYSHSKQGIRSGIVPDTLTDDRTKSARIRLNWRWSDTRLSYTDTSKKSGISTRTYTAEETITYRPARSVFLKLSTRYNKRKFKDSNEIEESYSIRPDLDWMVARWCKYSLEGFYGHVSGESEKTIDKGIESGFELSYGIWSGEISYEFVDERDRRDDVRREVHTLYFEIERSLW